ncbi:MAG: hypothetical protein R3F49_04885 [Planctomycetota bacterium]
MAPALSFVALSANVGACEALVDFLPGSFIDISATGTNVLPTQDGEFSFTSTVGNGHFPPGLVRVGVNGGVRFGPVGAGFDELQPANETLPSAAAFGGAIALFPYWDAYTSANAVTTFGSIQYEELNDQLIIQWTNVRLAASGSQDRITFQVQVPSQGDVYARFVYADISAGSAIGGAGATIGYQGASPDQVVQHSFNARDAVRDGLVLSLTFGHNEAIVDGAEGTYIDISSTGTPLSLSNEGFALHTTNVRNHIVTDGDIAIGSNGGIRLVAPSNALGPVNEPLPSVVAFGLGQALLPFWDDIDTAGGTRGQIYLQELPDRLIVQWERVGFHGAALQARATFQVQVFDQRDLAAQYLYRDIEGARAARGASATIGYQRDGGQGSLQFSHNTASIHNGTVLSLYRRETFGTNYCTASLNSLGLAAHISANGSAAVSQDNFFLSASSMPLNASAFLLVSRETGFIAHAGGSQGTLCLGGAIGRGVGGILNTGAVGRVFAHPNLRTMPSAAGPFVVAAGDTLSFQCWYRDSSGGVAVSNFTEGLQVRFEP